MNSVAIIGGGITGLTAAFRLVQRDIPVTLYEGGPRLGGVIQTVEQDGYLAEYGPNTLLETSPKISSLIRDVGLEPRRLYSHAAAERRYLVRGGKLVPLPTSLWSFLATPLFSTRAKLRLLAEPFLPPSPPDAEESIAQFVRGRLGQEFLDYAINPLVAGVYAGDPERLAVRHAFPKLHALEQRYGSLLRGQILGARERRRRADVSKQNARKISFPHGLQELIDALQSRLGEAAHTRSLIARAEGAAGGWSLLVRAPDGERQARHSAVLYAGTAYALAGLELRSPREWFDLAPFAEISYPPVASVVLGYRREDVAHPLDGFGVLVPEREGLNILGTLFSSSLFPHRAPRGHVTLTTYVGGARHPKLALLSPEALTAVVQQDLRRLLGVTGHPTFRHHVLFRRAIPQYNVGYGRFQDLMRQLEERAPGFFLAGNFRNGISLSDSIVAGHDIAERIGHYLQAGRAPVPAGLNDPQPTLA